MSSPYATLQIKNFKLYLLARITIMLGFQMQNMIVGCQVFYEITHDKLSLGLVGLAEAIPFICVALFGGHIADKFERKKIVYISTLILLTATIFLFALSFSRDPARLPFIYVAIGLTGIARGFIGPSYFALLSQIVPRNLYANASTWSSSAWHTSAVVGPAIAGLLYSSKGASVSFLTSAILIFISLFFILSMKVEKHIITKKAESIFESIRAGIKFVFNSKIILGALSLDLFAVLFGGAVAMLPAFDEEILKCGSEGVGLLRAATPIGALLMGFIIANFSIEKKTGKILLMNVALFGICMIAFAYSKNFWLSFAILLLSGAFDNVSVITRGTILQLMTPDDMRGRVSSVNSIFIGSSNEIGAFESGTTAKLIGLVPSVILGGCLTIGTVITIAKRAPELVRFAIKDVSTE